MGAHKGFQIVFGIHGIGCAVAMGAQTRQQIIAAGPGDRILARRIDGRDSYDIGFVKAGAEIVEQM